jgi:protoheme IX farnesyltransferase
MTVGAAFLGLYTPLKRQPSLNNLIGAIPGAVPPLIGWASARGSVAPLALSLFPIVFLWQLLHCLLFVVDPLLANGR